MYGQSNLPQQHLTDRPSPFGETGKSSDPKDLYVNDKLQAFEHLRRIWALQLLWKSILENIHFSSVNARHSLVQFKIVHKLHFSRSSLRAILYTQIPPCYATNVSKLANHFWFCPPLISFWSLNYISDALKKKNCP